MKKKYVEIQTFIVLENKTVKSFFFLALMFYSPTGYLASRMFWMPRQYFYGVSKDQSFVL